MPRVNSVKRARKEFTTTEDRVLIKKGDPYYYWKFRHGGYRTSSVFPKPQQLTQSGYKIAIYDLSDRISTMSADENIANDIQELIDEIQNLKDEQEESLSNMPEHLQDSSSSGQMLTERIDALDNAISELEGIDTDVEEYDENSPDIVDQVTEINKDEKLSPEEKQAAIDELIEEKKQERYEDILSEIQQISLD
jgi:hypothetical protein